MKTIYFFLFRLGFFWLNYQRQWNKFFQIVVSLFLKKNSKPTYDIWLQSFGHQAASHFQIFWGTLSRLQTEGHSHSLEDLDVIVDLKHAVEVEQVLKPVDKETEGVTERSLRCCMNCVPGQPMHISFGQQTKRGYCKTFHLTSFKNTGPHTSLGASNRRRTLRKETQSHTCHWRCCSR